MPGKAGGGRGICGADPRGVQEAGTWAPLGASASWSCHRRNSPARTVHPMDRQMLMMLVRVARRRQLDAGSFTNSASILRFRKRRSGRDKGLRCRHCMGVSCKQSRAESIIKACKGGKKQLLGPKWIARSPLGTPLGVPFRWSVLSRSTTPRHEGLWRAAARCHECMCYATMINYQAPFEAPRPDM